MIKTDVKVKIKYTEYDIRQALTERLPIEDSEITEVRILRRSLNLGDTKAPHYDMSVGVCLSTEREAGLLKMKKKVSAAPSLALSLPKSRLKLARSSWVQALRGFLRRSRLPRQELRLFLSNEDVRLRKERRM